MVKIVAFTQTIAIKFSQFTMFGNKVLKNMRFFLKRVQNNEAPNLQIPQIDLFTCASFEKLFYRVVRCVKSFNGKKNSLITRFRNEGNLIACN